jgi:hypothetical protein
LLYGDSVEMRQAIHAIRKKPDCAEPAVPYLLECLRYCNKAGRDFTSTEKVEVITTLGILAQRSSRAIPILADYYADHEDRRLASAAQAALRSIRRATAGKR